MRITKTLFTIIATVILLASCSSSPSSSVDLNEVGSNGLPTPAAIFARYEQASGGERVIRSHSSTTQKGRFVLADFGLEGAMTIYSAAPNKIKQIIVLPGLGTIQSGYDGNIGWSLDPLQGNSILEGEALSELIERSNYFVVLDLKDAPGAETIETSSVNDESTYRVKIDTAAGKPMYMHFSVDTGLMMRTDIVASTPIGEIPVISTINSYGDYGGYKLANSISMSQAGQNIRLEIDNLTFDDVPADAFELPSEIQAMLR